MSARPRFQGDYMGFSYGTKADGTPMHSSDLGIVRVSDGSRFNENLLPTIQDKTVQVPGGDGTYYFGSYYTQRQFTVSFAFDDLTEEEFINLKRHFGDKQVHDLIFDEAPYKAYRAKVTGTATIKHIPFAEGETNRVYKGEGSIQFTCYEPFARCIIYLHDLKARPLEDAENYILLDSEYYILSPKFSLEEIYANANEWIKASRIENYGNFGDVPVPFKKTITGEGELAFGGIKWKLPEGVEAELNTKTGVVKVKTSSNDKYPVGSIVNKYVSGNLTAKIPVGASKEDTTDKGLEFTCLYI